MNIGPYKGSRRCTECGSKGPGLRELEFRWPVITPVDFGGCTLILCPGCAPTVQHVLKNEFARPHLREVRREKGQA